MEYAISIEPKFVHSDGILSKLQIPKDTIVQGDIFKLGLRIVNIGEKPIPPFTIKAIKISSANNLDISHPFKTEYLTPALNPKNETILWISNFGTLMSGLAYISLVIVPPEDTPAININVSQINPFNSVEDVSFVNRWEDFFYVKSSHEHTQEKTNNYLFWLALATFFAGAMPLTLTTLNDYHENKTVKFCLTHTESSITFKKTNVSISCADYLEQMTFGKQDD